MSRIRIKDIIHQESIRTGIPVADLVGPSRVHTIVNARQYAIWRCRKETDFSLKQIGNSFGNRDHTTVLHAIRKVEAKNPELRMFMPEKPELPDIEPLTFDISDLRQKSKDVRRRRVVFPIKPVYKVA